MIFITFLIKYGESLRIHGSPYLFSNSLFSTIKFSTSLSSSLGQYPPSVYGTSYLYCHEHRQGVLFPNNRKFNFICLGFLLFLSTCCASVLALPIFRNTVDYISIE